MSKRNIEEIDDADEDSQWVSASKTANWMRNDPLLDYLDMYCSSRPMYIPNIVKDASTKKAKIDMIVPIPEREPVKHAHAFILEQGIQFEHAIVAHIKNKFDIHQVAFNPKDILLESKANETLDAMKRGVPFIYQGVLHDWESKTFGSPDFIVRSDYLHKLVKIAPLTKEEYSKPAFINAPVEEPGFHFDAPDLTNLNLIPLFDLSTPISDISNPAQPVSKPKRSYKRYTIVRKPAPPQRQPSPPQRFHYVIVDVKYSTLKMRTDGVHLTNGGNMAAYKAQMYIYQRALTKLQNFEPKHAYLLGRNWSLISKGVKKRGMGPFERLGSIDFNDKKLDLHIIQRTDSAVDWIRRLRDNGVFWSVLPKPSVYELYPNMSNKYDSPWHEKKKEISDRINEITSIWYCGVKHRKRAHDAGVTEWTDPDLTVEMMGFKKRKTSNEKPRLGDIIEKIIEINRPITADYIPTIDNPNPGVAEIKLVMPQHIRNNYRNWQAIATDDELDFPIEFYVDFETIHDAAASSAQSNVSGTANKIFGNNNFYKGNGVSSDMIFMIGVGWVETHWDGSKRWNYKNFTATHMTFDAERKVLNDFFDCVKFVYENEIERRTKIEPNFWQKIKARMAKMAKLFRRNKATLQEVKDSQLRVNLYHWGHIEPKTYERAMERHPRERFRNELIYNNWVNFYDVMRNEPIVVRGSLAFGLKAIVKGLNSNNLIDINYDNQDCANGIEAMAEAVRLYQSGVNIANSEKMNSIIAYNEVDCHAVFKIIEFLRNNHGKRGIEFGIEPGMESGDEIEEIDDPDEDSISGEQATVSHALPRKTTKTSITYSRKRPLEIEDNQVHAEHDSVELFDSD